MSDWIQSGDFWIIPEIKEALPKLDLLSFNELEQDILKNGLTDPIQFYVMNSKKVIIDGHHRLQICLKHNIPIKSTEIKEYFPTQQSAIDWMSKKQLARRNVPLFIKIEYVLNNIKEISKLAPKDIKKTTDKLAHILKCSPVTIKMVKKIILKNEQLGINDTTLLKNNLGINDTPNLLKSIREGSISINEAYKQLKPKKTKTETTNQQESKIENQDPIKYKSPLDAKNTIVDFNSLGIKKFKFEDLNEIKKFIIPDESNPIYLDKYDLKKTIKLYSNQNNSFILEHNKTKVIISLELLKYFQSLFISNKILINDQESEIKIDSVNYKGMILSSGLIEVLIEDILSVISNKQE